MQQIERRLVMKKFIVTLTLFFLLSIPAHALMSFGDIENAKNMSYSDLNFSGNYVTVTIENDNDAPVRSFCCLHGICYII